MVSPKPQACIGCTLYTKGYGFHPAIGSSDASICFVGETLGKPEASVYLNRALSRLGIDRSQIRMGNVCSCHPPNDWLERAPWEQSAIRHCSAHRGFLNDHTVYLTMGAVATRTVLSEVLHMEYSGKLNDWHGYVIGDGPYVIPTFDPAFLLKGNHKLFGAMLFDIKRAMEVASFGFTRSHVDLVVDPPTDWFEEYVEEALKDPEAWMAVDIETPYKQESEDDSVFMDTTKILRINFSVNEAQGVTVPWQERYLFLIYRMLKSKNPKVFWNERFDVPILTNAKYAPNGIVLDGMWAWHILQSDLPKGLGFVSPFYSDMLPWKHLAQDAPGLYAAQDAVQQLRNMIGIAKSLKQQDQWDTFMKFAVRLDAQVLHPMEREGILINKDGLRVLQEELRIRRVAKDTEIQEMVPPEVRPWAGGWKREPDPKRWPGAVKRTVKEEVLVCTDCGATEVGPAHKCKKGDA